MAQGNKRVTLVGGGVGVAQCALLLANLGVEVTLLTPFAELDSDSTTTPEFSSEDLLRLRPLLLRAASHPRVRLYTNSEVDSITGRQGQLTIKATKHPRYVRPEICTSCGRCEAACSVRVPFPHNGQEMTHTAIHAPLPGSNAVPSAYSIDKRGIAPCTASCPLGINVQGFVSLLSRGKVDKALDLIHESAPLAGILGRVCTHPCEDSCKRGEVDSPVFIKALHRYAADNAKGGISYARKAPIGSRKEKVGIVGSGPAGLACAWELARRGYSPVIFESHAVVGGMLATGIPRFRLPREVREKEVKAIEAMGVQTRTGITIGRDVTLPDLRERGYRAFFIAIGAHQNTALNIPGEDLEGVVDSISLLFELNLKVGASVGRQVVVIGGGNSAVDSARTARRRGKRDVTVIYRRTAEEMTAVKEDVEEALKEGVSIQYLTAPVEILGDGARVTGIRCQRMGLGEMGADGRRKPVPIPGSEFIMEADHVVLAIGQRPNTTQLNLRGVQINRRDSTLRVDPLTLQTSAPDVFAGGDCITGPSTVVEAVAAGMRAAESIDRYLRGRSLTKGRTLEKPTPVEVTLEERLITSVERAVMPLIPRVKRMGTYEETGMGLSPESMEQETSRCLNCALCSGCMECERACDLGAIFHEDADESLEVEADLVVSFSGDGRPSTRRLLDWEPGKVSLLATQRADAYRVRPVEGSLWDQLAQASSAALEIASLLDLKTSPVVEGEAEPEKPRPEASPGASRGPDTVVILCRCGESISSVVSFIDISRELTKTPGKCYVWEVAQACTEAGAVDIATRVAEAQVNRVVIAACRCCNWNQICFSCTDRRVMCQQRLHKSLALLPTVTVEFVNLREQCAWVHKNDPDHATRKATAMIAAALARKGAPSSKTTERHPMEASVLVVGTGLGGLAAASNVAAQGYCVALVSGPDAWLNSLQVDSPEYRETREALLSRLQNQGVVVKSWPQRLDFSGSPGDYEVDLQYDAETVVARVGAVILEVPATAAEYPAISEDNLLGRLLSSGRYRTDGNLVREITLGETAGIFLLSYSAEEPPREQILKGESVSAKVWDYLSQGMPSPRSAAVVINSKLCRACGECAALCPYIEMRKASNGSLSAYVDPLLCLGCGACIGGCPTGAISQLVQSDDQITLTIEALLGDIEIAGRMG